MFGAKKENKKAEQSPTPEVTVHTMPKNFLPKTAAKATSGGKEGKTGKIWLFVGGGIILLLLFVLGGLFVYSHYKGKVSLSAVKKKINHSLSLTKKPKKTLGSLLNQNSTSTATTTAANPSTSAPSQNVASSSASAEEQQVTAQSQPTPQINTALDSDNDGLPDLEEKIYGTNPHNPDTDGDGFLDGQEVANLYNPLKGNGSKLINSGLVKKYTNPNYNYSLLYPASWEIIPLRSDGQEVEFVSPTQEYIQVSVFDNPQGLTAEQWYEKEYPQKASLAQKIWVNNFMGVETPNKRSYYLTPISSNKNFIYNIKYVLGSQLYMDYPATLKMMVRSFNLSS